MKTIAGNAMMRGVDIDIGVRAGRALFRLTRPSAAQRHGAGRGSAQAVRRMRG